MEKVLLILRGAPGAGKSTVAELLSENGKYPVCCADDWFYKTYGEYKWSIEDAPKAHAYSQALCETSMMKDMPKVIVANTNINDKDMKPYEDIAKRYGYSIVYLIVENRHGGTSIHGVPDDTLKRMKKNLKYNIKV